MAIDYLIEGTLKTQENGWRYFFALTPRSDVMYGGSMLVPAAASLDRQLMDNDAVIIEFGNIGEMKYPQEMPFGMFDAPTLELTVNMTKAQDVTVDGVTLSEIIGEPYANMQVQRAPADLYEIETGNVWTLWTDYGNDTLTESQVRALTPYYQGVQVRNAPLEFTQGGNGDWFVGIELTHMIAYLLRTLPTSELAKTVFDQESTYPGTSYETRALCDSVTTYQFDGNTLSNIICCKPAVIEEDEEVEFLMVQQVRLVHALVTECANIYEAVMRGWFYDFGFSFTNSLTPWIAAGFKQDYDVGTRVVTDTQYPEIEEGTPITLSVQYKPMLCYVGGSATLNPDKLRQGGGFLMDEDYGLQSFPSAYDWLQVECSSVNTNFAFTSLRTLQIRFTAPYGDNTSVFNTLTPDDIHGEVTATMPHEYISRATVNTKSITGAGENIHENAHAVYDGELNVDVMLNNVPAVFGDDDYLLESNAPNTYRPYAPGVVGRTITRNIFDCNKVYYKETSASFFSVDVTVMIHPKVVIYSDTVNYQTIGGNNIGLAAMYYGLPSGRNKWFEFDNEEFTRLVENVWSRSGFGYAVAYWLATQHSKKQQRLVECDFNISIFSYPQFGEALTFDLGGYLNLGIMAGLSTRFFPVSISADIRTGVVSAKMFAKENW